MRSGVRREVRRSRRATGVDRRESSSCLQRPATSHACTATPCATHRVFGAPRPRCSSCRHCAAPTVPHPCALLSPMPEKMKRPTPPCTMLVRPMPKSDSGLRMLANSPGRASSSSPSLLLVLAAVCCGGGGTGRGGPPPPPAAAAANSSCRRAWLLLPSVSGRPKPLGQDTRLQLAAGGPPVGQEARSSGCRAASEHCISLQLSHALLDEVADVSEVWRQRKKPCSAADDVRSAWVSQGPSGARRWQKEVAVSRNKQSGQRETVCDLHLRL